MVRCASGALTRFTNGFEQAEAKNERRQAQHHQEKQDHLEILQFGEIGIVDGYGGAKPERCPRERDDD